MAAQTLVIRTNPPTICSLEGRRGRGQEDEQRENNKGNDKDTVMSCVMYKILFTSMREPEQSQIRDEEGSPPPRDGDNQDMSTIPAYARASAAEIIQ